MNLNIELTESIIASLVLDRLNGTHQAIHNYPAIMPLPEFPAIGDYWPVQGGIFAGLMRGRDDGKDYVLIKGPELPEGTFQETQDRAAAIEVDGHKDFRCPYRNEQSLLFANLPDEFQKKWYWSCERHQVNEDYAWYQDFYGGDQNYYRINATCLGCAVRVIPLQ